MQDIHFKTIFKTKIADTITPVGLYLRFRDKFANTLLLESSDYHSKEESFSFLCIEPVITIQAKNHFLSFSHKEVELANKEIGKNFNQIFEKYSKNIQLDCTAELKSFNGLYGYTTYDSVQYFENIALNVAEAPSAIPLLQYSFYRFIIAINHFNDEMTLIENIEEGQQSNISEIEKIIDAQAFNTQKFTVEGEETSNCTNEDFKEYVVKAKSHCKRGDVFQLVLSRQFQQKFKG
ncbi:MAG: anthranilate synthase component I, partial [Flavobacteriaceae bacterium CG_4_8_14_3_um_filter_31_8]